MHEITDGRPVIATDHSVEEIRIVPARCPKFFAKLLQRRGPFIALEPEGLRVDFEPPFVTFHERCDAVCEAAAMIVRATRAVAAL